MNKKTIYLLGAFLIIIGGFWAYKTFMMPENGEEFKNVSLQLKWIDQTQFAGFYLANRNDLYANEGLKVTTSPGGPDISPIQMVVSGVSDFGITGGDQIILAREDGIPVVALAVIYKNSPVAIGSLQEKNIISPKDLEGKRVGVVYGRDEETIYRALLTKEGVDTNTIEEVPVMAGISQITTDKFDAQVLYEVNEAVLLEENGYDVNLIRPRDYGITFYADTLFTTEKMIEENPDLVRAFIKASIAGWEMALANPEEALEETLRINPSLEQKHQQKFLELSAPLIDAGSGIGHSEKTIWEEMQQILLGQELLQNSIDIDSVFTNEFLRK